MQAHLHASCSGRALPCTAVPHSAFPTLPGLPRSSRSSSSKTHAHAHSLCSVQRIYTPLCTRSTAVERSRGRHTCCSAAAEPSAPSYAPAACQADLVLDLEGTGQKLHVFGVEHTLPQPHIAEFIFQMRPRAVVVETAVTPEHGSRPGNTISCRDRVIESPQAFFMRVFCGVAAQLQEMQERGEDPLSSGLWKQVSQGQFRGEQLAYIAALASNTKIVFGDRPKDITYRRLYGMSTLAQLDEGFGHQVVDNYHYILEQLQAGRQESGSSESASASSDAGTNTDSDTRGSSVPNEVHPSEATHWVDRVMMKEREALMCKVASDAALGHLPSLETTRHAEGAGESSGDSTAALEARSQDVVMVVGSGHLPGLLALWNSGLWKELIGGAEQDLLRSPLLSTAPLSEIPENQVGIKRGLLHCLLRLSVTGEVLEDLEATLGPLPPRQQLAFDAITEVYSSDRAMLACLPRDLLEQVWQGTPAGMKTDHIMDPWAALQPFRDNRFVNGGPGCTEEMVTLVRGLNFELD